MTEKPPTTRTTPTKFNRRCLDQVIKNLSEGLQTHPAIEKAGISVRHFYRELKKRQKWALEFKEAQIERDQIRNERRIEAAEAELYRRAVDGWEQQIHDDQGQLKSSRRRYSDQCLIFLLRKLNHERYGDKPTMINNTVQLPERSHQEILAEWRRTLTGGTQPHVDKGVTNGEKILGSHTEPKGHPRQSPLA